MIATLRELIRRRELLYILVWREIAVKYKQSVMGFLWAILMPALIVMAGIVVKYAFATVSGQPLSQRRHRQCEREGGALGVLRVFDPVRHQQPGRQP